MAKQRVNVAILDRVDGMPAMILANGNWGQWSNELKKYVDTGVRSYPEDDANNIKYFKLTNTSETPQAPTQTGGWGSLEELNKALKEAGWSEDPKSVGESARFQWMAVYSKENIPQPDVDTGVMKFVPRYTYSVTGLFNNFAPSPTVSFDPEKQVITITNPNGSSVAVKIPTPEAVKALSDMVAGLKKQVDKAVYSYEGSGAPTMDGTIVKDWLEGDNGEPITDDKTKADIFATHVGDAYFDKDGNTAYRFTLRTGGDPSNPSDYGWEVVKDNALSSAIAKIAEMEGETVKIWTETPTSGDSYKVGDILIYKQGTEWRYKHCVKANTPPQYLYSDTDWVEPYATVAEVKELREKLGALSSDLQTATGNIADLKKETEDIKGAWIEGIKDGIISEQERANLNDTSKRIDEEQAQLQSNVDYILGSPYFADKEDFKVAADAVIASGTGSIDKLQKAIADAIADSKITKEEREAVTQAFAAYDTTREALLKAIKDAKSEIDKQIPASVQVGGRNYAANKYQPSLYKIKPYHYRWSGDKSVQILIISDITNVTVEEGDEFTLSFLLDCDDIGQPQWRVRLSVGTKTISYLPPASTEDKGGLKKYAFNFRIGDYKQIPNVQVYSHNFSPDGDNGNYISHKYLEVRDIMLERGTVATDWTPAPEDVQAEIDAINANPPQINDKGTWEVYVPSEGKYVDSGRSSKGDNGKAPIVKDGNWCEWDADKGDYTDTGIKAQGDDALSVSLNRQGSFRTTYRVIGDSGEVLDQPRAVQTVEGGVHGKVVVTATIRKGVTDVTERARANGGDFRWLLNGTQIASGTSKLELGVGDHVDGVADDIEFTYDDTNAKNW